MQFGIELSYFFYFLALY